MKKTITKLTNILLPSTLYLSMLTNFLLVYLGFRKSDDRLRTIISLAIMTIIFLLLLIRMINVLIAKKINSRKLLVLLIFPIVWLIVFIFAYLRLGFDYTFYYWFLWSLLTLFPTYFAVIIIVYDNKIKEFFLGSVYYTVYMTPLLIIYNYKHIFATRYSKSIIDFYSLGYQSVSYISVFLIVMNLVALVQYKDKMKKWMETVCVIACINSTAALLFSGTRGAFVNFIVFLILFTTYMILKKINNGLVKKTIIAMLAIVVVLFIWTPPSSGSIRIRNQIAFVLQGEIRDYRGSDTSTTNEVFETAGKISDNNEDAHHDKPNSQSIDTTKRVDYENTKENSEKLQITGRSMIYKLAMLEIAKNPIFGLGSLGFIEKYLTYPHNFVLELLADFGIPIGLLTGAFCIAIFIKAIFISRKNKEILLMFLLGFSILPRFFFSGTLYLSDAVIFIFTASLVVCSLKSYEK